jgi:methionyl-tRNA formyltransferase
MTKTSKTIVFFGTDDFSLSTLQKLIEAGYNIAAVVTKPDSKSGRGQMLQMSSVKKLAVKHNIPVWQPDKVADINDKIAKLGNEVMGILVSYGKIIPITTINLFNPGIINVHPSLLPQYRGPSPIESSIKNGDPQTGVSIMKLTAGMDSGPIYAQIIHKLSGNETRPDLYRTLSGAGAILLTTILPLIIDGSISPTPQDEDKSSYCKLLLKSDALIDPMTISAKQFEQTVRAYIGFPKTKIIIGKSELIITKAHISTGRTSPLDVLCKDKKSLTIDELVAPSGKTISNKDYINGYL